MFVKSNFGHKSSGIKYQKVGYVADRYTQIKYVAGLFQQMIYHGRKLF